MDQSANRALDRRVAPPHWTGVAVRQRHAIAVPTPPALDPTTSIRPSSSPSPSRHSGALRVQRRRMRAPSIRPPSSPPSRLDALALRRSEDAFVDELFAAVAALGAPLMRGPLPARLSRREPRALRARPAHVRRAACRPSPTPARCGSPAASARSRASSPTGRRSTRAAAGRGGAAADRAALQALSPALRQL